MPSEVQITTISLPRTTKSTNGKLILLFERCLPDDMKNLWFSSKDMKTVARTGGLTNLPEKIVSNTLKLSKDNIRGWGRNLFTHRWHYCFAGERVLRFAASRKQRDF